MEIPIKQILEELATKINSNQTCKFNINRAYVLDGAVRGFTRLSYNPNNRMVIRFSDDKGKYEEAIDLGGPRREFLRLLLVALMQSSMFEGKRTVSTWLLIPKVNIIFVLYRFENFYSTLHNCDLKDVLRLLY